MSRRKPATRSGRELVFRFKAWKTRERVRQGRRRLVRSVGAGSFRALASYGDAARLFFRGRFFTSEISDKCAFRDGWREDDERTRVGGGHALSDLLHRDGGAEERGFVHVPEAPAADLDPLALGRQIRGVEVRAVHRGCLDFLCPFPRGFSRARDGWEGRTPIRDARSRARERRLGRAHERERAARFTGDAFPRTMPRGVSVAARPALRERLFRRRAWCRAHFLFQLL